jgi:hypothetical protein
LLLCVDNRSVVHYRFGLRKVVDSGSADGCSVLIIAPWLRNVALGEVHVVPNR